MRTLKNLIRRYMYRVSCVLVAVILCMLLYIQFATEQKQAYEVATRTISQIETVLEENQKELDEIEQEYRQSCLHSAETVARIIEGNPDVLNSIDELEEIAACVEIDEIHVFDASGRIFTGTHPEYYGLTFDSGEQISFFRPMLEDKTLKLVQDITPNTAEEKPMQYSAVWSENGEFIVQVGMEPVNVMKVTEKNELSYIFSLLRVNPEANYYAIDAATGKIVGATNLDSVGTDASEIGLRLKDIQKADNGFHAVINKKRSFCVFERVGANYIGRVVTAENVYQNIPITTFWILISLILVAAFLVDRVGRYMNKYVVDKISDVNDKLKSIADGNLEERVDIRSSVEFAELGNYVNSMVKSLLENNKKMSYVLSKTNMNIGTYEYGGPTQRVCYTENIPKIFSVDHDKMEQLASDVDRFVHFLDEIMEHPLPDEEGIYQRGEQFIRLEEIRNDDGVFGVAIDVTTEITKRMEIEKERDVDALTGLYNRRGLEAKLEQLFRAPKRLDHSAIIMVDADGLKTINDTYGHEKGDVYLKKIAEAIAEVGTASSVASRQGGDEFVLFLYGYDSEEALREAIHTLEYIQSSYFAALDENINVPLRFSMGYCLASGENDYRELLMQADKNMYKNKFERKKSASRGG